MEVLLTLNPEHVSEEEASKYPVREAARAVVIDSGKNVALLHARNVSYYKLPGGGIEVGEDHLTALQRECQEENGCRVKVLGEVGEIVEYRKFCTLKQISYCYFAEVIGQKGTPDFTEDEIAESFEQIWVSYEEAIKLLSKNEAKDLEGKEYIVPRDLHILLAVKKYFFKS